MKRIHFQAAIAAVCLTAFNGWARAQSYGVANLTPGVISLYAGMANGCAGVVTPTPASPYDGCPAANIKFGSPRTLAFDPSGNLYFVDASDHRIREISATGQTSTLAGTGSITGVTNASSGASLGDGGLATAALVDDPSGIAVDAYANVYFTDYGTNRVRMVYQGPGTDPAAGLIAKEYPGVTAKKGYIYTVAGTGAAPATATTASTGDGGPAISAEFSNTANVTSSNSLNGVAVDSSGNLYITDGINNAVREVNASTGTINTVAGVLGSVGALAGDGNAATSASLNLPRGIAVDAQGSIYIADSSNSRIRMINGPNVTATKAGLGYGYGPGVIHTIAGGGTGAATVGPYNGLGTAAKVANAVRNVSVDAAGNVYIANAGDYRIEKLDTNDVITLVAGNASVTTTFPTAPTTLSGVVLGVSSYAVNMDQPYDGVMNPTTGDLLVADTGVNAMYIVPGSASTIAFGSQSTYVSSAAQYVTLSNVGAGVLHLSGVTIAGAGFSQTTSGRTDCSSSAVLQPAQYCRVAILFTPTSAAAATGTVTITDDSIGAAGTTQTITLTGTGTTTASTTTLTATPVTISSGQTATLVAKVSSASGVPVVAPAGTVTFLSGTTTLGTAPLNASGVATLQIPGLMTGTYNNLTATYASSDNIYTASTSNTAALSVVSTALSTTTLTVSTQNATPGEAVTLNATVTGSGATPSGTVTFLNGVTTLASNVGLINGAASLTTTSLPTGYGQLSVVYSGSAVYNGSTSTTVPVLVSTNATAVAVLLPGIVSTLAGTAGTSGSTGDSGAASAALLNTPTHIAFDASGDMYISDPANNTIREVTASSGAVTGSSTIKVFAGIEGTAGNTGDGSTATSAKLWKPQGIAFDLAGNLYVADSYNNCIREITTAGNISTFAGNKTAGYSGDGGAATSAQLNYPTEVAVDGLGNVYIGDTGNNVIRVVSSGSIRTYAGTGRSTTQGFAAGDGGQATSANFGGISGLAVDVNRNVFVSDQPNQEVRKINAATGVISAVAGTLQKGGYTGDGGPATAAELSSPGPISVNVAGNLILADTGNSAVRELDALGNIYTVAGTGVSGYLGDAGPATSAELETPGQPVQNAIGNLYFPDAAASTVRVIQASASALSFPELSTNVTSAPLVVRLMNEGGSPLVLSQDVFSSAVFSQMAQGASDCNGTTTLAAGADCTFAVVANNPNATTANGTLTLTDNSGGLAGSQQAIALSVQAINTPSQTITFNPLSPVTYGVAPIQLSATASSGLPVSFSVLSGPGRITGSTLTVTGAGTIMIQATQAGENLQYRPANPVTVSLVVNHATLTVTATSFTQSGNTPIQPLTYTISGFVNNDTAATAVTGTPAEQTTATASSSGGIYPITISVGSLAATNYTFTFVNGQLTVDGVAQTITFNALAGVTYSTTPITLSATASSNLPVSFAVLSGPGTISGNTLTLTGAGSVHVQATQAGNASAATGYQGFGPALPVVQVLTVSPAALTINVANASRPYGTANPTFSSTVTGTVGNDVLGVSYTTPATVSSAPGMYSITGTLTGTNSGSYNVTSNPGTLTVTQATPQFLLGANNTTINYGGSITLTATFVANLGAPPSGSLSFVVNGTSVGTAPLNNGLAVLTSKALPAGSDSFQVSYTGDMNYAATASSQLAITVVSQTSTGLSVSSASSNIGSAITLTATVSATAPAAGTPTGIVTFYASGTSIGTATLSAGTASLSVSTLPLGPSNLTAQYGGATLYAGSTSTTVLETVTEPYGITLPSTSVTVTHGQAAELIGSVSANNGYVVPITFTCTGAPQNGSCEVTPGSFTASGSITTTQLSVEILTGPTGTAQNRSTGMSPTRLAGICGGLLLAMLFRKRRRILQLVVLVFGVSLVTGLSGCGSSTPQNVTSAAGTSTLTITGTSGNFVISTTVNLTVQ